MLDIILLKNIVLMIFALCSFLSFDFELDLEDVVDVNKSPK